MKLMIKKINPEAKIPFYAHSGDAGLDLFSVQKILIRPMERKLVSTGIKIQLPANTEAQVRPSFEIWNYSVEFTGNCRRGLPG